MSFQEDRFAEIANAIREKDGTTEAIKATDFATRILEIPSGGGVPPTAGGMFTGATIPLTYRNNTHDYENVYNYSSAYAITISGLEGRATITGNGTNNVSVAFDVSSAVSSLKNFIITLESDEQTLTYKGMHAHYGTTVTGILTFAYTNITKDGSEGTIGTNYKFIETASTELPLFADDTTRWNTIYSYQVLNTLIGNYSSTSIGNKFLYGCYAFNQPLTIPNTVTSIGDYVLVMCYAFNQPITIPEGVTSIGDAFLYYCYAFNQPLTIPSSVTSIGTSFLRDCSALNQPLTIPEGVTSIGDTFLSGCRSFNQLITIPEGVTSIGNSFLSYCRAFNQQITIPNTVTSIGNSFLRDCSALNQPLTIPEGVTSIGTYFLSGCRAFNQPLTILNGVTSIGNSFLRGCYAFNQPLTIPSSITSIGTYFLNNCYSLSTIIYEATTYPTDNNALSQDSNSKTSTNGAGIMVYGSRRANLITALPNRTSSPYRKLINGGS